MIIRSMRLTKAQRTDIFRFHKAIIKKFGQINVAEVYVSKEDFKSLGNSVKSFIKKKHPYLRGKRLRLQISWASFDLMPNENLGDAIRPGAALVIVNE